ncbi:MAG: hypothetical protein QXJ84_03010 [Desulfurococcaceae archaeon]
MKISALLLIVTALVILTLLLPLIHACMDPAGRYAVEVTLNKPGTTYNFTTLREHLGERLVIVDNSTYMFKYSVRYKESPEEGVLKQLDFLVVLYEAKFSEGAPYIEGLGSPENVVYYPGIRLELIVPPDTEICIVEAAGSTTTSITTTGIGGQYSCLPVYSDDFKHALRGLLDILVDGWQVVSGLTGDDVIKVVDAVEPGLAGWNNRLVYSETLNTWKPYYELVVKGYINGVLVKGNACSMQIPADMIEELRKLGPSILLDLYATTPPTATTLPGETIVPTKTPALTQVTQPHTPTPSTTLQNSTTIPASSERDVSSLPLTGSEKEFNGLAVVISLAVGTVVAFAVYMVFSRRY